MTTTTTTMATTTTPTQHAFLLVTEEGEEKKLSVRDSEGTLHLTSRHRAVQRTRREMIKSAEEKQRERANKEELVRVRQEIAELQEEIALLKRELSCHKSGSSQESSDLKSDEGHQLNVPEYTIADDDTEDEEPVDDLERQEDNDVPESIDYVDEPLENDDEEEEDNYDNMPLFELHENDEGATGNVAGYAGRRYYFADRRDGTPYFVRWLYPLPDRDENEETDSCADPNAKYNNRNRPDGDDPEDGDDNARNDNHPLAIRLAAPVGLVDLPAGLSLGGEVTQVESRLIDIPEGFTLTSGGSDDDGDDHDETKDANAVGGEEALVSPDQWVELLYQGLDRLTTELMRHDLRWIASVDLVTSLVLAEQHQKFH